MKIIFSMLACLMLLAGCGKGEPLKTPAPENLRILSLVTCADHIMTELGTKDKIVAIDRHGRLLDSMQNVPVTVAGGVVSREMLRKYRINYAIIWYYQRNLLELFNKEQIPVMVVEPVSLTNYPELVRKLGELCGKTAAAESLVEHFTGAFPPAASTQKGGVPVYIELYAPWKSPSANGYIAEIMQRAGGQLTAAGTQGGTVSPEVVALARVEVIFFVEGFSSAAEIAGRAALRNTPAVKNKRIFAIPRKLVCEGVAPDELLNFLSNKR